MPDHPASSDTCCAPLQKGYLAINPLSMYQALLPLKYVISPLYLSPLQVVLLNEGFQRQLIELARDHTLLGAAPPPPPLERACTVGTR